jgi:hypothetical protein
MREGDSSSASVAGGVLRSFLWAYVWERVLIWAVKHENPENSAQPAFLIAEHWRKIFDSEGLELPSREHLDSESVNQVSDRVQHCLRTGAGMTRIGEIFRYETDGGAE